MIRSKNLILAFLCAALTIPLASHAADISQSSSIVKFQHKLASKGNPQAQYRLACMFENGDGIEIDLEKAKYWYDLAAKSGVKAAMQRKTYLEVKEKGFDVATHADWLAGIKADVEMNKPGAILLQAQLYQQGIGVKKDLNKSLDLYYRISILGEADVEKEIATLNKEIAVKNKASRVRQPPVVKENAATAPVITQKSEGSQKVKIVKGVAAGSVPEKVNVKKRRTVQKPVKSGELSQAEKIKRYEKAREQLLKEQALIDALQSEMSGGKSGDIDDEI